MRRIVIYMALALVALSSAGCESERALDTLVSPSTAKLKLIDSDLRPVRLGVGYQTLIPSSFRCASDRVSTLYISEADGRARTLIFAQSNASLTSAIGGSMGAEMMSALMRAGGRGRGLSRYERERMVIEMPTAIDIAEVLMGAAQKAENESGALRQDEGEGERLKGELEVAPGGAAEPAGESLIDPSFLESLVAEDAPSEFEELRAQAAPMLDQGVKQLAAQFGLRPVADRTDGAGLGFSRIHGSFAGWSWLRFHHTDDEPAYRFARQEGQWSVRDGQRTSELSAYHLMGHLGPDDDELQVIILCEATSGCVDAEAIYTSLRSAKRNTAERRPPPSVNCADGSVSALASRYGFTLSER